MIQKNSSEILLINKKLFDFIVKPHTHRAYPGERAALSLYNSNPPCQTGLVRQDGPHPHRQAGSALDGRAAKIGTQAPSARCLSTTFTH